MTKKDLTDIALKRLGIYMLTLSLDSLTLLFKSMTYFIHPERENVNEGLIYLIANSFRTVLYGIGC